MDFIQLANRHRKLVVIIVAVMLLAGCMNLAAEAGLKDLSKAKQAGQEKQAQEAVQEHLEDLQRQQLSFEAQRQAELKSTLLQFVNVLDYDGSQLNATMYEYGEDKITDGNLPRKLDVTRKFAAQTNEFFSHMDGFQQFVHENLADLKKLGGNTNETELTQKFDSVKATFRSLSGMAADDLEKFAGSDHTRQSEVADVVKLLRDV
ncbi:hypothetical protein H0N96_03640 [Candidatus Micrarchaeota archaeon]|nr:hypothetical protein [Candidatus Micrarchaeota archaeon]